MKLFLSESDSELGDVLSESESDSGIRSIATSSDEDEYERQDRKNVRYVQFNERMMKDPKFFPGLVFASKKQLKEALAWYSVLHHKPLKFLTNDKERVYVRCAYPCNWRVWISKEFHIGHTDWCVKSINRNHEGCVEEKLVMCNSSFLAKALEAKFRVMPEMTLAATQVWVDEIFHTKISMNCARRTREKELHKINGDHLEQFNLAYTYCKELMKAQPGSTCFVDYIEPSIPTDPYVFRRLYVCLKPLVDGFHDGCKRVIGLDGCHTKGFYKMQILTAVGLDSNNGYWPIAWAVVEKETYETWKWFLEGLKENLRITNQNQEHYVVISDKQKGLERVIQELLPYVAKRNCAQHIYMNLKKAHGGGKYLRDRLWEVAKATNKEQFKQAMNKLRDFSQPAHKWLIDHAGPLKQWVRAFFPHNLISDTLCNNGSESFNAFIKEARDKPLITMLEIIRSKVMERIKDRSIAMSKINGPLCVKIKTLLDKNVADCVGYTYRWNGRDGFEVKAKHEQYTVDTRQGTCSCGAWQLSGIPCSHAIICLHHFKKPIVDYVHECYKKTTFLSTYSHVLAPVDGMSLWDRDSGMPLQPPHQERLAGRPKKNRKRDDTEIKKKGKTEKLKRWVVTRCSHCRETGHNVRGCPRKKEGVDPVQPVKVQRKKNAAKKPKAKQSNKNAIEQEDARFANVTAEFQEPSEFHEPALDQKMLAAIAKRKQDAIKRRQDLLKSRGESSSKAPPILTQEPAPILTPEPAPTRTPKAAPKPAPMLESEDDDIQIVKVVKDPKANSKAYERELRSQKRYHMKLSQQQNKRRK